MSKVFNLYTKNSDGVDVDRTWYLSSNVKYSECVDRDNELKVLRIVFNNATQYEYKDVDVSQYLLFRDAESQGKALNEYIKPKGYAYEKLDNADLSAIDGELTFRMEGGIFVDYNKEDEVLRLKNSRDEVIFESDVKLDDDAVTLIADILSSVGKTVKVQKK